MPPAKDETLAAHRSARPAGRTRRRLSVAASAATAALAAVIAPVLTTGLSAAQATAPHVQSGVFCGSQDVSCVHAFERWRGTDVTLAQSFLASGTWADIEGPGWFTWAWGRSRYASSMLITVPMLPRTTGATVAHGAHGDYDAHYTTLARRLVSHHLANARLRIGHEMNGTWSRWYAGKDPQSWAAYYRHIVTAMRAVRGRTSPSTGTSAPATRAGTRPWRTPATTTWTRWGRTSTT